jgi:tetratricopeptide (TPR) repeat protein
LASQVAAYLNDYRTAINEYSEAIRFKPDFADAFNNRGKAYDETAEFDKAFADYSDAIRLKPDFAQAYRNRATSYRALGEKVEAERDRAKADELTKASPSPSASPPLSNGELARAFFNRGEAYDETAEFNKAIADYSEAIRLRPDHELAFSNRGVAYAGLKQYDKAIADFSEAIRLKPDDDALYRSRADYYDALGKKVEAERDRKKADELSKASPSPETTP